MNLKKPGMALASGAAESRGSKVYPLVGEEVLVSIAGRSGEGEMQRLQFGGGRERHLCKLGKNQIRKDPRVEVPFQLSLKRVGERTSWVGERQ